MTDESRHMIKVLCSRIIEVSTLLAKAYKKVDALSQENDELRRELARKNA